MYPSPIRPTGPAGLARYGSAPGSLLASIADSIIDGGANGELSTLGSESMMSRFISAGDSTCLTSESTCVGPADLQRSYGLSEIHQGGSHLIRHRSSPAGFFSHLMVDRGLSAKKAIGNYSDEGIDGVHAMPSRRLSSQWSFSHQDSMSQISETSIPDIGESVTCGNRTNEAARNTGQSYISSNVLIGSWDNTNLIVFSAPPSKQAKDNHGDIITSLSNIDSQFSLTSTSLEMDTAENFLKIQQDSTPCRARAKRGCATDPRSVAERERRTRISKKLRKLQELVPNMDNQTNTSDMLELAVHYIKELQSQVQKLKQERADCTCRCKQESTV